MLAIADRSDAKRRRDRLELDIEIVAPIWSDEVVRGLVEDWLVPAVVDYIISDLLNLTGDAVR
jgi:hypothetical protein